MQQRITVKASSEAPKVVDWFGPLVGYIIEEKNPSWEITVDRRVYTLGEDDRDPAPFRRTWELGPRSVATEAGDAIGAGDAMEVDDVIEAGDAIEAPRKRPWEL